MLLHSKLRSRTTSDVRKGGTRVPRGVRGCGQRLLQSNSTAAAYRSIKRNRAWPRSPHGPNVRWPCKAVRSFADDLLIPRNGTRNIAPPLSESHTGRSSSLYWCFAKGNEETLLLQPRLVLCRAPQELAVEARCSSGGLSVVLSATIPSTSPPPQQFWLFVLRSRTPCSGRPPALSLNKPVWIPVANHQSMLFLTTQRLLIFLGSTLDPGSLSHRFCRTSLSLCQFAAIRLRAPSPASVRRHPPPCAASRHRLLSITRSCRAGEACRAPADCKIEISVIGCFALSAWIQKEPHVFCSPTTGGGLFFRETPAGARVAVLATPPLPITAAAVPGPQRLPPSHGGTNVPV